MPASSRVSRRTASSIASPGSMKPATRTIAPPARFDDIARRPAIRAEAMPRVPGEQRLAFRQRRQMIGLDDAAHRDRAQVGDEKVLACLERLGVGRIERDGESGNALD